MQLMFHLACAATSGLVVSCGRVHNSWFLFVLGEVMLGVVASFYFNAFHECIHNTAFRTSWLNSALAHLLGFLTFRGKAWYLLFHWSHHRYTNDPDKDPELSGSTPDRADFTQRAKSTAAELWQYAVFLSGYPFGFERIPGIVQRAFGKVPPHEFWVITDNQHASVRKEYTVWCLVYGMLAAGCGAWGTVFAAPLWHYWILPHCIGAAHLRYYQAAEHRSCESGAHTDITAWVSSRTTCTWWFYCRLAWNMPYHAEHHAWPNVPFHRLPQVYEEIAKFRPKSGCDPGGENGYFWLHKKLVSRLIENSSSKAA